MTEHFFLLLHTLGCAILGRGALSNTPSGYERLVDAEGGGEESEEDEDNGARDASYESSSS